MTDWRIPNTNLVALPLPPNYPQNSPAHSLVHTAGYHVDKTVTLNGNGASTENLFTVTGSVRAVELSFHVTVLGDSTTFSGVKFELDDGTAQTDITAAVDGSGCLADATFVKVNTAANPLLFMDNSAGFFQDAVLSSELAEFVVAQKAATTTYIRLAYTGDGTTDITIVAECHYVPFNDAGAVTAV